MDSDLNDDLMIGAKAIARFLGVPVRQVFYMAENAQLPLFKIGGKWAGRKSTIEQHIHQLEEAVRGDEVTLVEAAGLPNADQLALARKARTNVTGVASSKHQDSKKQTAFGQGLDLDIPPFLDRRLEAGVK